MMAALSLLFCLTASAQTFSLEDVEVLPSPETSLLSLTADAPNVVRGQVVKRRTVRTDNSFKTRYTFAIYETYAGHSAEMFSLWLPGGTLKGVTQKDPSTPIWEEGDEVVLFLKENGDIAYKGMFTLHGKDLVDPAGRVGVGLSDVISAVAKNAETTMTSR